MRLFYFCILILLISGCSTPSQPNPTPTLHIVRVGLTPSAMVWQDELYHCSQTLPGAVLAAYEEPNFMDLRNSDQLEFFIQLGGEPSSSNFVTQLGTVKIVWISNITNPLKSLTLPQLAGIYGGSDSSRSADDVGTSTGFELWVYPQEEILAEFLSQTIPISKPFLSTASLAPDPAAMMQAVFENPYALGFVPESWVTDLSMADKVNIIPLVDPDNGELLPASQQPSIPVFAIANKEPGSTGREVLLCFRDLVFQYP